MPVRLLMGNQAIAYGAVEAGVQVATGYPGTPSSEIMATLSKLAPKHNFHAEWSVNEKVPSKWLLEQLSPERGPSVR